PYYIGGWSFGGFVAFEMAQQLHKAGEQVALLAILDTPAPIASNQPSYCETLNLLTTVARSIPALLLDYGRLIPPALRSKNHNSELFKTLPSQLLNEFALHRLLEVYRSNSQAVLNYKPQTYPNAITLFRTQKRSQKFKDAA
ncbi:non-ribosomal peptide synthetase, partial [Corallococcus praedator]